MILIKSDLITGYLRIDLPASGQVEQHGGIRADLLKNRVLKYLRVDRGQRPNYYLSRFYREINDHQTSA